MKALKILPSRKRLRYYLIALAAFLVTVAAFYAEEDWRGWVTGQMCKKQLLSEGVDLDWQKQIPSPAPDDQNVFGVPEMQQWFVATDVKTRSTNALSKKMSFPGWSASNRVTIAQLTIGFPGTNAPPGATLIKWGDSQIGDQIARAVTNALGPLVIDPIGAFYTKIPIDQIRPAQIFLQCQAYPAEADLKKIIPDTLISTPPYSSYEHARMENFRPSSCDATIFAPGTAEDYLAWWKSLDPQMQLIRQSLARPYAQMKGDYSAPENMPIPNFVTMRAVAQRLATDARCHLLLGQPQEALDDLSLVDGICRRLLQENKPMTLVSAMINVAIRGLAAQVIDEGLQAHEWGDSQLAALETQGEQINLLSPVEAAFEMERLFICNRLYTDTPAEFMHLVDGTDATRVHWIDMRNIIPRGWCWQNMANAAEIYHEGVRFLDPTNRMIYPSHEETVERIFGGHRRVFGSVAPPYFFLAANAIPNYLRADQTTARNQTQVNHTVIVCALERYRLAHGVYPAKLDNLMPHFIDSIPHDLIGGMAPRYRLNADGTFLLYSTGWDQKDHGGNAGVDYVWPETIK